ncbi:hypothetical protein [Azospirillum argentinense]|uniref:hypothetical protein n=1 Tax=Azospirillum argentinense TaxID=2970906 RepID=UPI0032DEB25B
MTADRASLGPAAPDEVAALAATVDGAPADGLVEDWRFFALRVDLPSGRVTSLRLLGELDRQVWITSDVLAVDDGAGLVRTRSGSTYGLGSPGQGEAPQSHLLHLRRAARAWGWA